MTGAFRNLNPVDCPLRAQLAFAEADPIEVFRYHRKAWILEAKDLADEHPTLMPANIAAVVYSAGQKFSGKTYPECEEVSPISAPRRAPIEAACGA
jgi:hypothetical protein